MAKDSAVPTSLTLVPKVGALDRIKEEHGIVSDSQLAARLGISAPLLSQVRTGRRGCGPLFLVAMLEEFGYGLHHGEDCIYETMVDGTRCELAGP